MQKIFVTGFEPFGGQTSNSSWEVVKRLPSSIGDFQVFTMQVPVVFGLAAEIVIKKASDIHPNIILCIGQASGRSKITPEYVAINLRNAMIPDNANNEPHDAPVIEGGPDAYFATLPVRKMAETMAEAGVPAEVSYSAGTYVCNDLMYGLLHHYHNTETYVGFIHVPELYGADGDEDNKSNTSVGLNIDDAVRAITNAILSLEKV